MAYVIAAPEMMAAAATDVATIGSNVSAAHMAAAAPTVAVIPAAADEVSAAVAQLFSQHAQGYQALAGQAAAFHDQFVQHLTTSAGSYVATEAANASLLQPLDAIVGSFTSTIAALQGQIHNLLINANAILGAFLFFVTTNPPGFVLQTFLTVALAIIFWPITLALLLVILWALAHF
jgi:hypothetical protein